MEELKGLNKLIPVVVIKDINDTEKTLAGLKKGGITRFLLLFRGSKSRSELVATFMAVLELCRNRVIKLVGGIEDCAVSCQEEMPKEIS